MSFTAFPKDRGSYVYASSSQKHASPKGAGIVRLFASQTSCVSIKELQGGKKGKQQRLQHWQDSVGIGLYTVCQPHGR